MTLKNQKQIKEKVDQLTKRIALIYEKDGRLQVSREIYDFPNYFEALRELLARAMEFRMEGSEVHASRLLSATRRYVEIVNSLFAPSRPRFRTTMRFLGGPIFIKSYDDAVLVERLISGSLLQDDLSPQNLPEQKPSPIYAKVAGTKIVLDSGRALQPLLSSKSLEKTKSYLKDELLQLTEVLRSSNVDQRLTFEVSKLSQLMEFDDDAGAIILGLHAKKVVHMTSRIEDEMSSVLAIQVTSTLMQISHFAAQYQDWIEFLRNAAQYPAKQAVDNKIDASVANFVTILADNPDSVDERIPATVKLIETGLTEGDDTRGGAIYAAVRGFENVCIVAVKFAFEQALAFLKETGEKIRSYSSKILAVAIVTLALGIIGSFLPVIQVAPELNWVLENLPKIEKIRDLLK